MDLFGIENLLNGSKCIEINIEIAIVVFKISQM